jgi:hypothetical protein
MRLQRKRFIGGQHFEQKWERIAEPGAYHWAELPFRIGEQRL